MSAHPYDVLSLNNGANIIFTPCPGTKTQNLADSIATLKAAGTHMLLSLMPQKELEKNNVQTINTECNKHDITWFHLPINDDEAPKQPFTSSWNTTKQTYYKPYSKNKPLPYIAKAALVAQGWLLRLF